MKSYLIRYTIYSFLFFSLIPKVHAQTLSSPNSHYHDFDFWIGSWNVFKYGTDTIVGLSEIKPILNHKTIEENYQSISSLYKGTSNNIFNAAQNR